MSIFQPSFWLCISFFLSFNAVYGVFERVGSISSQVVRSKFCLEKVNGLVPKRPFDAIRAKFLERTTYGGGLMESSKLRLGGATIFLPKRHTAGIAPRVGTGTEAAVVGSAVAVGAVLVPVAFIFIAESVAPGICEGLCEIKYPV